MIAKREETRKTYDHYDKKMEEIYKNKKGNTDDGKRVIKYRLILYYRTKRNTK